MADYKKIRHTEIKGEKGTTWYVELWKDGFTGTSTEMTLGGEGFEITWNGQGSTRDRVFLGSECVLNLMVQNDTDEDLLYDILDSGFKKYFIRIYKNSTSGSDIWWYGYIQPSFDTIENAPYPYVSKITATDSYGYYEKELFSTFNSISEKENNHNLVRLWLDFLHNMDLAPVNLIHNPYFRGSSNKGWVLQPNDTMTSSGLNISSINPGYRHSNSFSQNELIVGETYELNIQVNSASGTLKIYDGYPNGTFIGNVTSTGLNQFTYTQSSTGTTKGLYFLTILGSAFNGQIDWVSLHRVNNVVDKEVLPFPSNGTNFMWTATDWHTSASTENDATRYYISKGAFATNTNFPFEYKESDALKESLKIFNTVGFLAEGTYNFIQPNHYIDNTTGQNNFYKYNSTTADASPISTTNLCEINKSTNLLLGGSSFTYEAPFKSVSTVYTGGSFTLPQGADITDDGTNDNLSYTGQIIANQTYTLDCFLEHSEKTTGSNIDWVYTSTVAGHYYKINPGSNIFNYALTIKAVSSAGDKYLYVDSNGDLGWTTSVKKIVFVRNSDNYNPFSGTEYTYNNTFDNESLIPPKRNSNYFQNTDGNPCLLYPSTFLPTQTGNIEFRGRLKFKTVLPELPDTSEVFIKCEGRVRKNQVWLQADYRNVNYVDDSLVTKKTTVGEISLEVEETSSLVTNEQRFTETNQNSTATENYELSDVTIGVNQSDKVFSVTDINNNPITSLFYRGTDQAGAENFTRLLVKEFLEMQQSPLQILQGSIQSANISPLDIVKYKLNSDDAQAKYYMFLGGTFKANSEIMEGEWFRIKGD